MRQANLIRGQQVLHEDINGRDVNSIHLVKQRHHNVAHVRLSLGVRIVGHGCKKDPDKGGIGEGG